MGPYQTLFRQYVAELSGSKELADAWWTQMIDTESREAGSREAAEARVRERWPFGPTSHPDVIRVYRKYFLACERLNEQAAEQAAAFVGEPTEADWGTEDTRTAEAPADPMDIDEPEGPIGTPTFMFEFLYGRRQDLADFMAYLVFAPIGEENGRAA
jgi:hypothetical protein